MSRLSKYKYNFQIFNNNNQDINIYECFNYFENIELMNGDNQMFCNIYERCSDILYSANLYSMPNYLILNLNR